MKTNKCKRQERPGQLSRRHFAALSAGALLAPLVKIAPAARAAPEADYYEKVEE